MQNLLERLLRRFLKKKSNSDISISYKKDKDDSIPRYPPFLKGIPAAPVGRIVADQKDVLDRIRFEVGQELYGGYYYPAICRYAAFVHLLPASEKHHHRGAGGLLRHGLEVGYNAIIFAKSKKFDTALSPSEREENAPKWVLASFLAGLTHDLGKPLSDYKVISDDGKHSWNPFTSSIEEWASEHGLQRYFLNWHESRYRKHESLSSLIAERIIDRSAMSYLSTSANTIIRSMFECITNQPSFDNKLYEIVEKSDHLSTEKDIKESVLRGENANLSVPVEKYIIDAIKLLNTRNEWGDGFNEIPPLLFCADSLYLTSPALDRVCDVLQDRKVPGIPADKKSLTEILINSGFAKHRDTNDGEKSNVWPILKSGYEKTVWAIRFKDWSSIYPFKPESIPGYLVANEAQISQVNNGKKQSVSIRVEPEPNLVDEAPCSPVNIASSPSSTSPSNNSSSQQMSLADVDIVHEAKPDNFVHEQVYFQQCESDGNVDCSPVNNQVEPPVEAPKTQHIKEPSETNSEVEKPALNGNSSPVNNQPKSPEPKPKVAPNDLPRKQSSEPELPPGLLKTLKSKSVQAAIFNDKGSFYIDWKALPESLQTQDFSKELESSGVAVKKNGLITSIINEKPCIKISEKFINSEWVQKASPEPKKKPAVKRPAKIAQHREVPSDFSPVGNDAPVVSIPPSPVDIGAASEDVKIKVINKPEKDKKGQNNIGEVERQITLLSPEWVQKRVRDSNKPGLWDMYQRTLKNEASVNELLDLAKILDPTTYEILKTWLAKNGN